MRDKRIARIVIVNLVIMGNQLQAILSTSVAD